tara:strand:+ start:327 stop:494 length:168 start_codon:yes stop_codon:yes gene_type:complete
MNRLNLKCISVFNECFILIDGKSILFLPKTQDFVRENLIGFRNKKPVPMILKIEK